jgi:hypothetical protein
MIGIMAAAALVAPASYSQPESAAGTVCSFTSEESSARYKICYYDCAGEKTADTVPAGEVCAATVTR